MSIRTREAVQVITVANGETGDSVDFKPEAGNIIGCVIHTKQEGNANPGIVRAAIKDATSGEYVSRPQFIENYRSREAAYLEGCKPLRLEGGRNLTLEITAKQPFTDDFEAELVLIYDNDNNGCV